MAGGLGVRGMRERARLLGGWLRVESTPGWGTCVALTLPRDALESSPGDPGPDSLWRSPRWPDVRSTGEGQTDDAEAGASDSERVPMDPAGPTTATLATPTISVLLADDHPAVRDGLRLALSATAEIRVVGAAASGREALELAQALRPNVLLLDVQMPDGDGLAVLRQLRQAGLPVKAIVLTAHATDASIAEAMQAGAIGYLQKDVETPRLIEAIRRGAQGRPVFSPEVAERLHRRVGLLVNLQAGRLTPREREVLQLLATGMRRRAIAQRLGVSEATIKFHVLNLYQKFQTSSRVEALNRAREWGLLS
jgi:DNA-binding NarL/FixJ family response regulator